MNRIGARNSGLLCWPLDLALFVNHAYPHPGPLPGEWEDRFQRFVDRNPAVSVLELQPGANDFRNRNICLPLPGGEGRGEGKRLPSQTKSSRQRLLT